MRHILDLLRIERDGYQAQLHRINAAIELLEDIPLVSAATTSAAETNQEPAAVTSTQVRDLATRIAAKKAENAGHPSVAADLVACTVCGKTMTSLGMRRHQAIHAESNARTPEPAPAAPKPAKGTMVLACDDCDWTTPVAGGGPRMNGHTASHHRRRATPLELTPIPAPGE